MITKSVFTLRHSELKRTKKQTNCLKRLKTQITRLQLAQEKKNTVKLMAFKAFLII